VRRALVADSARRADSLLLASTSPVAMVDTVALREKLVADSVANAQRTLREGIFSAITRYTNAIQAGDMVRAQAAYPNPPQNEQQFWQRALERNDLRIRVERGRNIALSNRDSIANFDVVLRVRYIDRSSQASTDAVLRRRATVQRVGAGWRLVSLAWL
jgi:antirestriction protein